MKPLFDDGIDVSTIRTVGWMREESDTVLVFQRPPRFFGLDKYIGYLLLAVLIGMDYFLATNYAPSRPSSDAPLIAVIYAMLNVPLIIIVFASVFGIGNYKVTIDVTARTYRVERKRTPFSISIVDGNIDGFTIGVSDQTGSSTRHAIYLQRLKPFMSVCISVVDYRLAKSYAGSLSTRLALPQAQYYGS